ncbi:MAG: hypothetical protein ACN6OD_07990 [Alcaligenes sp.]
MRSITGSLSAMKKRWKHAGLAALSSESLQAVIDKEIPAVVISDFATLEECDQLAAAILSMKAKEYEFGKPGSYLGIPLPTTAIAPRKRILRRSKLPSGNEQPSSAQPSTPLSASRTASGIRPISIS